MDESSGRFTKLLASKLQSDIYEAGRQSELKIGGLEHVSTSKFDFI